MDETVRLDADVFGGLHMGVTGLLLTVDELGWPHAAFTWMATPEPHRFRAVADRGSTTLVNLERTHKGAVEVIVAEGTPWLIKGTLNHVIGEIPGCRLPLAVVELQIVSVRNQAWGPVTVSPIRYIWKNDEMVAIERMVLKMLREG